jgi:hypothetical protein
METGVMYPALMIIRVLVVGSVLFAGDERGILERPRRDVVFRGFKDGFLGHAHE